MAEREEVEAERQDVEVEAEGKACNGSVGEKETHERRWDHASWQRRCVGIGFQIEYHEDGSCMLDRSYECPGTGSPELNSGDNWAEDNGSEVAENLVVDDRHP